MADLPGTPIERMAVEARGAVVGHNVRYVLLWGTLAAVTVMAIPCFMMLHIRAPG